MPQNCALIVGALGVTGRALVEHLADDPDWSVVALSRRAPDFETSARFLSVDLHDADATRAALAGLAPVTHVFFTAYSPDPDIAAEIPINVGMLANLMDAIEPVAENLQQCAADARGQVSTARFWANTARRHVKTTRARR